MTQGDTRPGFPENLPPGWYEHLHTEKNQVYFQELSQFLLSEYRSGQKIFPAREHVLRALQLTDYSDVKVCILGQDPYHGDHQANGLCFAVSSSLRVKPPSLVNIFKEMRTDLHFEWDQKSSELIGWAKQGVLLLNTVLTVRRSQAFSHQKKGWETFTDKVIQLLDQRPQPIVFILWGSAAQKKAELIRSSQHKIIQSAHPSPLSAFRGFFGSKPFSKTNEALMNWKLAPIDWTKIDSL